MIIRVQSSDGMKRVECQPFDAVDAFYEKVRRELKIDSAPGTVWYLSKSHDASGRLQVSKTGTMGSFKNGDILFVIGGSGAASGEPERSSRPGTSQMDVDTDLVTKPKNGGTAVVPTHETGLLEEDEVDKWLWQQDGRIMRARDMRVCQHKANSRCLHCAPLDPFDEEYLKSCDPPIKFLSFHAYLRKLKSGVDKGKFAALEDASCRIKPGCTSHAPWPEGICTKCQPSAITLAAQRYRHVDNVQFQNGDMVDRFLDFWRKSGAQRVGLLLGRYEAHDAVPLGIRATVMCIYEPPQIGTESGVELLADPHEAQVDQLLDQLGLRRIGWIFTDLVPLTAAERAAAEPDAIVQHHRGTADTYFLSAQECIMAANLQNKAPNACRLAAGGQFGSKFVTVVVTGDARGQIGFEAYQVSAQGAALVRDGCLVPTQDAPELAFVRESSAAQYVPDVFYAERDRYGNEVQRVARPLPVAYLLVDMPVGFPREAAYSLTLRPAAANAPRRRPFETENRAQIGEQQSLASFAAYLDQFLRASDTSVFDAVTDWHVLHFFATDDFLGLRGGLTLLLTAVRTADRARADAWFASDEWSTVLQLVVSTLQSPLPSSRSPQPPLRAPDSPSQPSEEHRPRTTGQACSHCTFINPPGRVECDICGLPLNP